MSACPLLPGKRERQILAACVWGTRTWSPACNRLQNAAVSIAWTTAPLYSVLHRIFAYPKGVAKWKSVFCFRILRQSRLLRRV